MEYTLRQLVNELDKAQNKLDAVLPHVVVKMEIYPRFLKCATPITEPRIFVDVCTLDFEVTYLFTINEITSSEATLSELVVERALADNALFPDGKGMSHEN